MESRQSLGAGNSSGTALGDLDGDGDLDAFVGNYQAPDRVWMNDGSGAFMDSGLRLAGTNSSGVALGDLNGDGDLDALVVANSWQGEGGSNTVWMNRSR